MFSSFLVHPNLFQIPIYRAACLKRMSSRATNGSRGISRNIRSFSNWEIPPRACGLVGMTGAVVVRNSSINRNLASYLPTRTSRCHSEPVGTLAWESIRNTLFLDCHAPSGLAMTTRENCSLNRNLTSCLNLHRTKAFSWEKVAKIFDF